MRIANDVGRHHGLRRELQHVAHSLGLDRGQHGIVYRLDAHVPVHLKEHVHHRAVGDGHPGGDAVQPALQLGQNLAYGLGGAGGGGDDVLGGRPAPPLVGMRHVRQALVVGVGMNGVDDAFADAKGILKHLGYRRETVGRAACVRDQPVRGLEPVFVDPDHHGVVDGIAGRYRQQCSLSTGLQVL